MVLIHLFRSYYIRLGAVHTKKRAVKMIVAILVLQMIVMAIVYLFVDSSITSNIKNSTIKSMETIAQERSEMIENYIEETERYLTAFSRGGEVQALLKNPEDVEAVKRAQAYTEVFSKDRDDLEGIYISSWDSHVLTHTNAKVVGIYTRKDEALAALQESLKAAEGVYNAGIVLSPASGEQVISIYRGCFDQNNQPIGLVGGGIFTQGLVDTLDKLPAEGMEKLRYCMVKVDTGEYLFHDDKERINTVAEEEHIQNILKTIQSDRNTRFGSLVYQDEADGEEYIASYSYMGDRDWAFIITDPSDEVFQALRKVKIQLAVICIVGVLLLTLLTALIINYLLKSLKKVVDTLSLCYGAISAKTKELYSHSDHLVESVTENTATVEELSASLESTDHFMESVRDNVESIDTSMDLLLDSMKKSVDSSEDLIASAQKITCQSKEAYSSSIVTFEETKSGVAKTMERMEAIVEINKLADVIMNLAKETNLLSLNALLEAARAGEAGKGFNVVAKEIGDLANTVTEMAAEISGMCEKIDASVEETGKCFDAIIMFLEETVMKQFGSISQQSQEYGDAVAAIRQNIMNLDKETESLRNALRGISENIHAVKGITHENGIAVSMIADMNVNTAQIAESIQAQSDDNKKLVVQLENIIKEFG